MHVPLSNPLPLVTSTQHCQVCCFGGGARLSGRPCRPIWWPPPVLLREDAFAKLTSCLMPIAHCVHSAAEISCGPHKLVPRVAHCVLGKWWVVKSLDDISNWVCPRVELEIKAADTAHKLPPAASRQCRHGCESHRFPANTLLSVTTVAALLAVTVTVSDSHALVVTDRLSLPDTVPLITTLNMVPAADCHPMDDPFINLSLQGYHVWFPGSSSLAVAIVHLPQCGYGSNHMYCFVCFHCCQPSSTVQLVNRFDNEAPVTCGGATRGLMPQCSHWQVADNFCCTANANSLLMAMIVVHNHAPAQCHCECRTHSGALCVRGEESTGTRN